MFSEGNIPEKIQYFTHGMTCMFFLFASLRLLRQAGKTRLQKVLTCLVAFWTFQLVKDMLLYFPVASRNSYLYHLLMIFDMWAVPFCSYYLFELVSPGWLSWKKVAILQATFVLATAGFAATGDIGWFHFTLGYSLLYGLVSITVLCFAVKRYNRYIRENYSYTEHIDVRWLTYVTSVMFVCLAVWIISCLWNSEIGDAVYYLLSAGLWAMILFYSELQESVPIHGNIRLRTLFNRKLQQEPDKSSPAGSDLSDKLSAVMLRDELFLNPKLTLSDLAIAIGTNRTYLSVYLNTDMDTTFYDYINSFRIRKAQSMLAEKHEATMIEISEACGFNSLSTFRRCFVKEYGMSFSDYRRQQAK